MRCTAKQPIIVNGVGALWMNLNGEDLRFAGDVVIINHEVKILDRDGLRLVRECSRFVSEYLRLVRECLRFVGECLELVDEYFSLVRECLRLVRECWEVDRESLR